MLCEQAEKHLIGLAAEHDPRELRILGRKVLEVIAPDIAEDHEHQKLQGEEKQARKRTWLRFRNAADGTTYLNGRLPTPLADRLRAYLDAFASPRRPTNRSNRTGNRASNRASNRAATDGGRPAEEGALAQAGDAVRAARRAVGGEQHRVRGAGRREREHELRSGGHAGRPEAVDEVVVGDVLHELRAGRGAVRLVQLDTGRRLDRDVDRRADPTDDLEAAREERRGGCHAQRARPLAPRTWLLCLAWAATARRQQRPLRIVRGPRRRQCGLPTETVLWTQVVLMWA